MGPTKSLKILITKYQPKPHNITNKQSSQPVVLYGHGTVSLKLENEQSQGIFKWDTEEKVWTNVAIIQNRRKMHTDELLNL